MSAESVSLTGETLLNIHEVCAKTSLGRTTIYRRIGDGTFPAPVSVGQKASRWLKSEVENWIANLTRRAA